MSLRAINDKAASTGDRVIVDVFGNHESVISTSVRAKGLAETYRAIRAAHDACRPAALLATSFSIVGRRSQITNHFSPGFLSAAMPGRRRSGILRHNRARE